MCEVPRTRFFFHTAVLLMPSRPIRLSQPSMLQGLLRSDGSAAGTASNSIRSRRGREINDSRPLLSTGLQPHGQSFRIRSPSSSRSCCAICASVRASHVIILSRLLAVACSVGTQYGVKYLVDGLSAGPSARRRMAGIRFAHVADRGR
jgi:hypothetical protein